MSEIFCHRKNNPMSLCYGFLVGLFISVSTPIFSANFDVNEAIDTLSLLQGRLDKEQVTEREIKDIREQALGLRAQALECVDEVQPQVETLNLEVEALQQINPEVDIEIFDRLANARSLLGQVDAKLKNCYLSVIRSTLVINLSNKLLSEKDTNITIEKGTNITIVSIVLLIALVGLAFFLCIKFLNIKTIQETFKNLIKSEEKIPKDEFTFLQYLANYYSNIVSYLAVLTAIIGFVLALVAMFTEEVLMGFVILLGTPLAVILLYGFVAIIIEIHRHLKSIDKKLSGEGDSRDG